MKNDLYFLRTFRTPYSEVWLIDYFGERIGIIHLHLKKTAVGDVILLKEIPFDVLDKILENLNEWIVETIEEREDFIFSVFQAIEINSYSDTVDHDDYPPTKKDLNDHGLLIKQFLSKHQDTKGKLQEHIVKDYFEKLGFTAKKANADLDNQKIDIVAENDDRVLYCQVKLGQINSKEISKISENISKIKQINLKTKTVVIVADSFPSEIELLKERLENNFSLKIWTISKSQILKVLPEYKRTT